MSDWTFESLAKSDFSTLEKLLVEGRAPEPSSLVGYEFRGWNVLAPIAKPVMGALGFQRFAKGFFRRGGDAPTEGYNVKITSGGVTDEWVAKTKSGAPIRHSYYRVHAPGNGRREAKFAAMYPNALYLDYGEGNPKNGLFDGDGIRDFVVQISPDLLLGKAYFKLGPLTVVGGFFIAERWHKSDFRPA